MKTAVLAACFGLSLAAFAGGVKCDLQSGNEQCRGQLLGSSCETYGPHGGKMDGECKYTQAPTCGCFPIFEEPVNLSLP